VHEFPELEAIDLRAGFLVWVRFAGLAGHHGDFREWKVGGVILREGDAMDEVLTIEEIKARYAPNWVLIGDPQTDDYHHVLAGEVLVVSPDREAVYDKALELRPTNCAFRFLGEWPKDAEFIL
jgi:hypothetical protein